VAALRNEDILCFSNDWQGDPLSKMHIMRILARDNRVLWVNSLGNRAPTASRYDLARIAKKLRSVAEGMREVEPNVFVLTPMALPIFGSRAAWRFNRALLRLQLGHAMRQPIVWAFLPSAEWAATGLDRKLLVYHCVDEFSAFPDAPSRAIAEAEERLVRAADLVITSSEPLLLSKRQLNPRTVLVRHGVDLAHFARAFDPATPIPPDIADMPRPIFGFFGLVAEWVDLGLIGKLAASHPTSSVVLVGAVRTNVERLARLPNVHLLGRRPYADLPGYCKAFDVALVPFRMDTLTFNANPLKVREYLAAGLPVVSTRLPEVAHLGGCLLAANETEFLQKVDKALAAGGCKPERADSVRSEAWEMKVEEIRQHVTQALCSQSLARRERSHR
jgi:glycosyltransferase involved in cell wall biosynthesis